MKLSNKFISILCAVALLVSALPAASAVSAKDNFYSMYNTEVVVDNANERIAITKDRDLLYQAHYDKKNSVLSLSTYQDGKEIYKSIVNLKVPNSNENFLIAAVATPIQSETGFGYLIGDPISSYACSNELVENGTYPCRGFNMYNTSNPSAQEGFRNAVDTLIDAEISAKQKHSTARFTSMVTIVLAFFGQGVLAYATAAAAVGMTGDAIATTEQLGAFAENCGSYYSMLYPYRIING